ncbi:MAG: RHS repeat-associated core domain-containing protein, partial [Planctomycetales bacterium]|nr:RHS repeat-associated core domain-containing protein [Planctomycetales bacterium]
WDRFGRTVSQEWEDYGASSTADQVDYTYDYAGNRLTRDIPASLYSTNDRDQKYTYDGLHRLQTYDGGTLSGSSISGTPVAEQDWTLDQLGNWSNLVVKAAGTTTLDQDRAHNDVNEIDDGSNNGITTTTGTNWVDPVHDAAGNMTTIPQPQDPSDDYKLVYDAWNRVVQVKDGFLKVQVNQYDGLNRRIERDESNRGGNKRHFYYSRQWQVLEERIRVGRTIDADPLSQYVYHPDYVDAMALRYYDEDTDGSGIVEHYYLQDANYNVTAVTDDGGTVVERYAYTPYGEATVLDADFSADADGVSDIANEYLYTGRRRDPETGLQLNRNRFYHQQLGRWVNRDPIGYEGSPWNLYEYVGSRATIELDPSGQIIGLTCEQQDNKNASDRADCKNKCFRDITKSDNIRGRDLEDIQQELDDCNKGCQGRFPDLDCNDTCYFAPEECLAEAAGLAAAAASCALCGILKKGNVAACSACYELPNKQRAYNACVMGRAIKD